MTFILLMIAIVSFAADDAIVKNGISYNALMNEARATIIDKNLTDIVVESEVNIGGTTLPVTYVDKQDYDDVFPNAKTFTIPATISLSSSFDYRSLPSLQEWRMTGTPAENGKFVEGKCLYEYSTYDGWKINIPIKLQGELRLSDKLSQFAPNVYNSQFDGVTALHLGKNIDYLDLGNNKMFPNIRQVSVDAANANFSTDANGAVLISNNQVALWCQGHSSITIPEGVTEVFYNSDATLSDLKELTLPSTLTSFYCYYLNEKMPNLERFIMPKAGSTYKVSDGVLYSSYDYFLPHKGTKLDLTAVGCTESSITLKDYPCLQTLITNDELESLELENLPSLQTLKVGKSLSSFNYTNTMNIANFDISSENSSFYKDANGIVRIKRGEDVVGFYIPASVTSYCIPKDEAITEGKFAQWPHLKTLTMEEGREIDDSYVKYYVENNVVYKDYYNSEEWIIIDAAGGISNLMVAKNAKTIGATYGEGLLTNLPNLETISVAEGNKKFCAVDGYLCQKNYLYGGTGENEWDAYELDMVLSVPRKGSDLEILTTLPEGFNTDYPFMGFTIGEYLFAKNPNIKTVKIGNYVNGSSQCSFMDCENLEKVELPSYSFSIGHMMFYDCDKLSDVTFSNHVEMKSPSAFYNTAWWRNQTGDMRYAGSCLYYVSDQVKDIEIPDGTTCVSEDAFEKATENTVSVTIPSTMQQWYDHSNMHYVERININASYIDYGQDPFVSYSSLKEVKVSWPYPQYFESNQEYHIFPYDLSNVTLIVPDDYYTTDEKTGEKTLVSAKENYAVEYAYEWNRFGKLVDVSTSGIGGVKAGEGVASQVSLFDVRGNDVDIHTTGSWSIFSISGQMVKDGRGTATINLPSGIYVIKNANKTAKFAVR